MDTSEHPMVVGQMSPQEDLEYLRRKINAYQDEERERRISLRILVIEKFGVRDEFEFQHAESMVDYIINGLPTPQPVDDGSIKISTRVVYEALQDVAAKSGAMSVRDAINEVCRNLGFIPTKPRG